MSKGLTHSSRRGDPQTQEIIKQTIALDALPVVIDGAAAGWGTAVVRGLAQGNILLLGAVLNATLTKGDANIVDAFDGDIAVGTAPTADATLSGSEVDVIPSTALVTGAAGVSSGNRAVSTGTQSGAILNNTDGSLELNVNVLIDDADITDDSSLTIDGALHVAYIVLGDD